MSAIEAIYKNARHFQRRWYLKFQLMTIDETKHVCTENELVS